jgi:hypothetical protein
MLTNRHGQVFAEMDKTNNKLMMRLTKESRYQRKTTSGLESFETCKLAVQIQVINQNKITNYNYFKVENITF